MQSGILERKELKRGILISIFICVVLVISVIFLAFGVENMGLSLLFLALGIASIWAAIKYTVGGSAYGYRGLGDVFVFLFFGLLAVVGSMFLFTKFVTVFAFLPAIAIGALSAGVLNLNNLRDFESDRKAGKNTLVVKMGFANGKRYHYTLLGAAFFSMLSFIMLTASSLAHYIPLLAFVPIAIHMTKVYWIKTPALFDPELKKLALSTFLLAVLMFISYYKIL